MSSRGYIWQPGFGIRRNNRELIISFSRQTEIIRVPDDSSVIEVLDSAGAFDKQLFYVPDDVDSTENKAISFLIEHLQSLGAIRADSPQFSNIMHEMMQRCGNSIAQNIALENLKSSIIIAGDSCLTHEIVSHFDRIDPQANVAVSTLETFSDDLEKLHNTRPIIIGAWLDYLSAEAQEFNSQLQAQKQDTLTVMCGNFDGQRYFLGPVVIPGISACLNCWVIRYRSNLLTTPEQYRPQIRNIVTTHYQPPLSFTSLFAAHVSDMVSELRILREYSTASRPGSYSVLHHDHSMNGLERHLLHRVPRCSVCKPQSTVYPQVWHHGTV